MTSTRRYLFGALASTSALRSGSTPIRDREAVQVRAGSDGLTGFVMRIGPKWRRGGLR
jgi:hypothetical protein